MLADHLSLHLIGIDVEMLRQMNTEAQAVEEGAGAEHAIVPSAGAGNIGERIGRIGYHQYDRARGSASTGTANPSRANDSDLHDSSSHSQHRRSGPRPNRRESGSLARREVNTRLGNTKFR